MAIHLDPAVTEVAGRHEGLLSLDHCRELGISPDRLVTLVRRGTLHRVVRGVYDTNPQPSADPDALRRRAAWTGLLAIGPHAISVGACALALHGALGLPRVLVPEVAMADGRHIRGPQGVRVRRYRTVTGTVRFGPWTVSDVPTALVHALPGLPKSNAVAVLDSVLNRGMLTDEDLGSVRRRLRGQRGCTRLEHYWPLVNGLAESPLETWVRLDCIDAGLPPDRLQMDICDPTGRFVARVDMVWFRPDGSMVVAEVDGRDVHASPEALFADRLRQNELVSLPGITVLRFTARDLRVPGTIARAVRLALARD